MVRALCARPALGRALLLGCCACAAPPPQPARPNVLWVMMDDLRALLPPQRLAGGGGGLTSATPNIDRLARDGGVVFPNAYCQVSVCAPSRSSFMSGRRPDSMRVWQWESDFRKALGAAAVSLPQHFKNHGYLVVGAGKTYEPDYPARYDQPYSWSPEPKYLPLRKDTCGYQFGSSLASALTLGLRPRKAYQLSACADGGADRAFFEHACASFAIDAMRLATDVLARPFFVAAGFYKPHLPWRVPERFARRFATSDARGAAAPARRDARPPAGMPDVAWSAEGFRRSRSRAAREASEGIRRPMRAARARGRAGVRGGRGVVRRAARPRARRARRARVERLDARRDGRARHVGPRLPPRRAGRVGKAHKLRARRAPPFVLRAPWWSRGAPPRARRGVGRVRRARRRLPHARRALPPRAAARTSRQERRAPRARAGADRAAAAAGREALRALAVPALPGVAARDVEGQRVQARRPRRVRRDGLLAAHARVALHGMVPLERRRAAARRVRRARGGAVRVRRGRALARRPRRDRALQLGRRARRRRGLEPQRDGRAQRGGRGRRARRAPPALEHLVASPSAGCDGGSATDAGCVSSSAELARRLGDALACGDAARVAVSAAAPKPNCAAHEVARARARVHNTPHRAHCCRTRGAQF